MANECFTEKLKKFEQLPIMGLHVRKQNSIHKESSIDSCESEQVQRSKVNVLNFSSGNTSCDPSHSYAAALAQSFNEQRLLSSTVESAHTISQQVNTDAKLLKQDQNDSVILGNSEVMYSKSSANLPNIFYSSIKSPDTEIYTNSEKLPVQLQNSSTEFHNNMLHPEVSTLSSDHTTSTINSSSISLNVNQNENKSIISQSQTMFKKPKKPPPTLPKTFRKNQSKVFGIKQLQSSHNSTMFSTIDTAEQNKLSTNTDNCENSTLPTCLHDNNLSPVIPSNVTVRTDAKQPHATMLKAIHEDQIEAVHCKSSGLLEEAITSNTSISSDVIINKNESESSSSLNVISSDRLDNVFSRPFTHLQHTSLQYAYSPEQSISDDLKDLFLLPVTVSTNSSRNENQDYEHSLVVQNEITSVVCSSNNDNELNGERQLPLLSNVVNLDRPDDIRVESTYVTLNEMLSSECMFFELEDMTYDYTRRDPRTVKYPIVKAAMPKVTADEINILKRYLYY